MLVLALDTTAKAGSMALAHGDRVLECYVGDESQPHACRLPADLVGLVGRHGRELSDLDLLAVAAGPGSFTGLRIGIATMQGLAFASGRPLIGVSALEALALTAAERLGAGAHTVAAWMDAQRNEVFSGVYLVRLEAGGEVALTTLDEPVAAPPADVARRWRIEAKWGGLVAAGSGAVRYRSLIEQHLGSLLSGMLEPPLPIAPAVARLACRRYAEGGMFLPHAIAPIYVRRPDAELVRDRRQAGS
ncbi:MAG: tRNA (adenosine(37)-N6)-threonylcarbamoyltransferase complex dimerization subunit type 1 TsaB [Acidobacteriota bacterium]